MHFRTHITLILTATVLVPFLALSFVESQQIDKTIRQADADQQQETQLVQQMVQERLLQVIQMARLVRNTVDTGLSPYSEASLSQLLKETVTSFPVLKNLHIDDVKGESQAKVLAFYPLPESINVIGHDHSHRWHAHVPAEQARADIVFSPVIQSSVGVPQPLVTFVLRGKNHDFLLSGALALSTLFDDLALSLKSKDLTLFVVDQTGQQIYPSIPMTNGHHGNANEPPPERLHQGKTFFLTQTLLQDRHQALPSWRIIVAKPQQQRIAEREALMLRTFLYGLILIALTLAAAWWVSLPLKRALASLTQDLESDVFDNPATTITDGPVELITFQTSLRQVRRELREHNRHLSALVEERSLELASQEWLFFEVFNEMEDGVFLLSTNWDVVQANRSATRLFPPVTQSLFLKAAQEHFSVSQNATDKMIYTTCESSQERIFEARCFPFSSHRTSLRKGLCLLVRDITREEQLDRLKADLVGIVAHELKTPITTCQLQLEQAKASFHDPLAFQAMQEDLAHLNRLVKDWLAVAKIDSGSYAVYPEPTIMPPLLNKAIRLVRSKYDFAVTLDITEETECLWLDPQAFLELMVNLLTNACRYSKPHEKPTIKVQSTRQPDGVTIKIYDHGIGIAPQDRERIFERFYQVDHSTQRQVGGTGLGLVICRAIVQAHGGTIVATEEEGQTCFVITLPQPVNFSSEDSL